MLDARDALYSSYGMVWYGISIEGDCRERAIENQWEHAPVLRQRQTEQLAIQYHSLWSGELWIQSPTQREPSLALVRADAIDPLLSSSLRRCYTFLLDTNAVSEIE